MIIEINERIKDHRMFFETVVNEIMNLNSNDELSIDLTCVDYIDLKLISILTAALANRYLNKYKSLKLKNKELIWTEYIEDYSNISKIYMVYLSNMSEYLEKVGFNDLINMSNAKYAEIEHYGTSGKTEKKYTDPKGSRFFILRKNDTIENFHNSMNSYLDNMLNRILKPEEKTIDIIETGDYGERKKIIKSHFYEICQNACNHSGTGGIALVETNNRNKKAKCTVTDYGIGIFESIRKENKGISIVDSIVYAITKRRNYNAYGIFGVINFVSEEEGNILICTNGYLISFNSEDLYKLGFPIIQYSEKELKDHYIDCNNVVLTHLELRKRLQEYVEMNLESYFVEKESDNEQLNNFQQFNGVHFEFEINLMNKRCK